MFILDRRHLLALTSGAVGAVLIPSAARAGLAGTETYTASPQGGNVDSVVVMGEQNAVLIDAQFTVPEATALADMIAATGRSLETVFITHYHPDHVLGLAVIMDRFPEAKPVTHAKIQPRIAQTAGPMIEERGASAPAGVFADRAVIPEALGADHILLEGERLDILDPMHGDTDLISAVHIPALDTLVTGDLVYADTHTWVAENTTAERIAKWRANLDVLEAIGAGTVIPGHRAADTANDASAFGWTRGYLGIWEQALADTSTAEDLRAALLTGREDLGLSFAVEAAVGAVYPNG